MRACGDLSETRDRKKRALILWAQAIPRNELVAAFFVVVRCTCKRRSSVVLSLLLFVALGSPGLLKAFMIRA